MNRGPVILLLTQSNLSFINHFLNIMSDLLLFSRISMFPHRPQWSLEQIVHGLDGTAFHFGEAEVYEHLDGKKSVSMNSFNDGCDGTYHACVSQKAVKQEYAIAHFGDHVGCGARDAVVYDPVYEEAY